MLWSFAALLALPGKSWACAACYGASDSTLATGMNWGIVSLLGVVGTVLTCFLAFFVHIIRKSEAQVAEEERANHRPAPEADGAE